MITAIYLPADCELEDAAEIARARGLQLYTDGERTIIARRAPERGCWAAVAVKHKPTPQEPAPCAA